MRILFASALFLSLLAGCGSDTSSTPDGGAGGQGSASGVAQVRFRYQAEWKDHLGACPAISEYRIKFGATPSPISVPIDVTPDSLGEYVGLEGGTYKDSNVLHIFTCIQSQTSKQTKELYGSFGADLSFEASKKYTVTLGGSLATVTEEP
jgi:hypothetical protein